MIHYVYADTNSTTSTMRMYFITSSYREKEEKKLLHRTSAKNRKEERETRRSHNTCIHRELRSVRQINKLFFLLHRSSSESKLRCISFQQIDTITYLF
jgi:hypothetical protein